MSAPSVTQQSWRLEEREDGQLFHFIVGDYVVAVVFRLSADLYRTTMLELTREVIDWPASVSHEFDLPDLPQALGVGQLITSLYLAIVQEIGR